MISALRKKLNALAMPFIIGGHVLYLIDLLADYIAQRLRDQNAAPAPDTSPVLPAPAPGPLGPCVCGHKVSEHAEPDARHLAWVPCRECSCGLYRTDA